MKNRYATGEEVQLGDAVEYRVGGLPFRATVVSVASGEPTIGIAGASALRLTIDDNDRAGFQQVMWPSNPHQVAPVIEVDADEDLSLLTRRIEEGQ